jgi:hypothetical protein
MEPEGDLSDKEICFLILYNKIKLAWIRISQKWMTESRRFRADNKSGLRYKLKTKNNRDEITGASLFEPVPSATSCK